MDFAATTLAPVKHRGWRAVAAALTLGLLCSQVTINAAAAPAPLTMTDCRFSTATPDASLVNAWHLQRLNMDTVWPMATGKGIKVAVIDTGINTVGSPYLSDTITGDDGATRRRITAVDLMDGPRPDDNDGMLECDHGTLVTSLLAAGRQRDGSPWSNRTNFAGIAPDVEVIAYRTLTVVADGEEQREGDPLSATIEAVRLATAEGVDIINLSQTVVEDPALKEYEAAIADAIEQGIVVVAAAGNAGAVRDRAYPAAFPGVISVGSSTQGDAGAQSSALVGNNVTIGAPGENVVGLRSSQAIDAAAVSNQAFELKGTGTSFATPIVSGVVALLLEYERRHGVDLSPAEVKERLVATADPPGHQVPDLRLGAGIVNPLRALLNLKRDPQVEPTEVASPPATVAPAPTPTEQALPVAALAIGVGSVIVVLLGVVAAIAIPAARRSSAS
ncbi:type VII secretion-associated serine protease mycosin [Tessaracoccus defluvii]